MMNTLQFANFGGQSWRHWSLEPGLSAGLLPGDGARG